MDGHKSGLRYDAKPQKGRTLAYYPAIFLTSTLVPAYAPHVKGSNFRRPQVRLSLCQALP